MEQVDKTLSSKETSDENLMLQYQQGEQAAFEILYRRYKDVLYRYFLKHCSDRSQSEELYQEVWIKLINSAARYKPKAKFKTYLFTIAHNTLVDFYRKAKPSQIIEFEEAEMTEEFTNNSTPLAMPEDEFTLKQKTNLFIQTLEALPADQKEAAILHFEQEMSVQEIAEITQVKTETAKSRLRYAKNKLKAAILD
ncbi:MAG: sigma-70 family RNA polymerase sigma factor [Gammaproteobacteria bacterium]|nr:sigma-70 family RNA polymerase sigma factor [Gammaproteobacteria bacterium]